MNASVNARATHLEDFSLGPWFTTDPIEVDEQAIVDYARQFDPQPFHLGHDSAAGTFFGSLAASGWHTASLTMRLMVGSGHAPGWGFVGRAIESLEWPRPTRPGDRLHLEAEVIEIRPSRSRPDLGMLRVKMITRNQNGDPAQVMTCAIVVPTRSGVLQTTEGSGE